MPAARALYLPTGIELMGASNPARDVLVRLTRGSGLTLLGALFNQGSTLLAGVMVARILGPSGFGEFALVLSTLMTLSNVLQVANSATTNKYVAEFRVNAKDRASSVLALGAVFGAVTGTLALVLVMTFHRTLAIGLGVPHIARLLLVGAPIALGAALAGYLQGALSGLECYRALAIGGILNGTFYFVACWLGTRMGGLTWAVMAVSMSYLEMLLLLGWLLRRQLPAFGLSMSLRAARSELRLVTAFGLPGAISQLITLPSLWAASAVLAHQPSGLTSIGLYAATTNLRVLALFVPSLIVSVGMNMLNAELGREDSVAFKRTLWQTTRTAMAVASLAALGVAVLGPTVIRVFGRGFEVPEAVWILRLFACATVVETLTMCLAQVLQAKGRMWLSLSLHSAPRDVAFVVVALWLAPGMGAVGIAMSYLASRALCLVITSGLVAYVGLDPVSRTPDHSQRSMV